MFTVFTADAQKSKSFAGTVKVSIKYEGNTNPQLHIPVDVVFTIFGNKYKVQVHPIILAIYDGNIGTQTMLYDIPGNKIGYELPKEYFEEEQSTKKYTYKKGSETKIICGYVCTRYDIIIYDTEEDEEITAIVYTTTEIGENSDINTFDYPGLAGFPLYEESIEKGVKTIQEAIEVKPTKVKDIDFLVPSSYIMKSPQEVQAHLQALFGDGEK
jgi:hypothetical protein